MFDRGIVLCHRAVGLVEEKLWSFLTVEVKHVVQLAGAFIEGNATQAAKSEVVLDELGDGGLLGVGRINEVGLGVRGNHDKRLAGTRTALTMLVTGNADLSSSRSANLGVLVWVIGAVEDLRCLVVVPTIGIIVGNNHGGGVPLRGVLQLVDVVGNKSLFIERVGVACVTILEVRRLKEGHSRQVALLEGGVEIL